MTKRMRSNLVLALVVAVAGILAATHFHHGNAPSGQNRQIAVPPAAPDQSNAPPNAPAAGNTPPTPKVAPPTPEQLSQDYARNLQRSITSQVNSQVDKINAEVADQLRQTARTLANSKNARRSATEQATRHSDPCTEITNACKAAGFVNGGDGDGVGIGNDCIVPIIKGTPQPSNASIPLPTVSPYLVAHCKAVNPKYGHLANQGGAASKDEDNSSDPDPQ